MLNIDCIHGEVRDMFTDSCLIVATPRQSDEQIRCSILHNVRDGLIAFNKHTCFVQESSFMAV